MSVYVFGEPGSLVVKIGKALYPSQRERQLQRSHFSAGRFLYRHDLTDIGQFYRGWVERQAHRILRSRFWLDGEWFVCGPDVAKAAVRQAAKRFKRRRRRVVSC